MHNHRRLSARQISLLAIAGTIGELQLASWLLHAFASFLHKTLAPEYRPPRVFAQAKKRDFLPPRIISPD